MHLCAADCCGNSKSSPLQVQQCVERCQDKVQTATSAIDKEMNDFQNRLMRCAQDCEAKAKDSMPGGDPAKADMSKMQATFDACMLQCANTHADMIPKIKQRLEAAFKKI